MMFFRPKRLHTLIVCATLCLGCPCTRSLSAQQPATQQQATPGQTATPPPAQPPTQQTKPQNPFETVPETKPPDAPPQPRPPSTVPNATGAAEPPQNIIEAIEFRGSRRVPQDTLRALVLSKKGDNYDEEAISRDFRLLWNSGRFDDIRLEREVGKTGWIIRYVVTERRVVRTIKYEGNKSVSVSEILDRFKERRVGLQVESQYDPNRVQRAAVVLKEYLAERGRPFATVEPVLRQVPPSSLEITFRVEEGTKVKVGNIEIAGNKVFSDRAVRRAMRNLRPVGVPHSIFLENLFAKAYDSTKLEQDQDMIRNFYQEKGYFKARVIDRKIETRDVGGKGFRIPLFYPNKPGKRADITLTLEEDQLTRLRNINFVGVKLFRTPETLMKPLFQMQTGDIFSTAKLRKGLENARKLYGEFGYIDFVLEPEPNPVPNSDQIDLTLTADEGKQFFLRRLDFVGNNTTRDKVIRRELLIDEGDIYNTRLWELSILRLNQLGYFEALKAEDAADVTRDTKTNTVDLKLKVKERGKNSISLNGGVSGVAGSFIGFNYSTNNFLGLGETLSLESQLGDRIRSVQFGFQEPYLFDKPLQAGFTVFTNRFNYDQGREVSLLSGRNYIPLFNQLGRDNLLNYVSTGYGFTTYLSYPLRRSFARLGLSYGYNTQDIKTLTTAARQQFEFLNFRNVGGPNSLEGIRTSYIVPSYTYNTVNHPITPTAGKSLFFSIQAAGSVLGGNVNSIEPTLDATYFRSGLRKGHVIGAHVLGRMITGYGGKVAPPFNRFYMGGENDIRGFDIWGISPYAYIPSDATINVLNDDGTQRNQRVIVDGKPQLAPVTQRVPVYQLVSPGGDTQVVTNLEYRIPIFGPVTLAAFVDAGVNKIALPSQLGLNPGRLSELNGFFPQASFNQRAQIAPATQKLRVSTGLELKVLLPIVQAPFRFYWAYNPSIVNTVLTPPVVFDRSQFPNEATYQSAILSYGQPLGFRERRRTFRFTIGKTF